MTMDISGIPGYNKAAYEAAAKQYVDATGKTTADFDNRVMTMAETGLLDMNDILSIIRSSLPNLPNPVTEPNYPAMTLLPSIGANVMALLTDISNAERKQISEEKIAQTKAMIAKIKQEADNLKTKAITQLVLGIASGLVTIGAGIYSTVASSRLLKQNDLTDGQMMVKNTQIGAIGQIITGSGRLVDSASAFTGTWMDAKNTALRGDEEQIRAMRERLDSIDDNLKQLIAKMISSTESIVQSSREARNRVLA